MNITRKQKLAMAVLVVAGAMAGGAVLWSGRSGAAVPHAGHAGHADSHEDEDRTQGQAADDHAQERVLRLSAQQQSLAGITLAVAGAATLREATDFSGELRFNEDRTAHVVPRLSGIAESVKARLGQTVRAGQVLAVIASPSLSELRSELLTARQRLAAAQATHEREKKLWQEGISAEQDYLQAQTAWREASIAVDNARQKLAALGASGVSRGLNLLEIKAPLDGTVVEKHLALGESVKEDASIFTISDLGSVWAEFAVAPRDLALVRVGQQVIVSSSALDEKAPGTIAYVGSLLGEQTRTARARVTLTNPQGAWRPGLFVTVRVLGAEQPLPLAVPAEAVQTFDRKRMVFKAVPGGFQLVPIKTGRSDGRWTEILQGLDLGDRVVTRHAHILKSELGKASAEHGH